MSAKADEHQNELLLGKFELLLLLSFVVCSDVVCTIIYHCLAAIYQINLIQIEFVVPV